MNTSDIMAVDSLVSEYLATTDQPDFISALSHVSNLTTPQTQTLAAMMLVREGRSVLRHNAREVETTAHLYRGRYKHGTAKAYRGGCNCEDCARMRRAMDRVNETGLTNLAASVKGAIDKYAADLKMTWTTELLATSFAVDTSGRTVTWGSASITDHERRIAMLTAQATTTIETAARHRAAVNDIVTTGSATLAEAVERIQPTQVVTA